MSKNNIIDFASAAEKLAINKLEESMMAVDPTNRTGKYILVDKTPVPESNLMKWSKWMENKDKRRIVKQEEVRIGKRIWWVSTVFLALNHNFYDDGPPILFETMIFNHTKGKRRYPGCDFQDRYSTWDEAINAHERVVKNVEVLTACRRKLKKLKRKGIIAVVQR